MPRSVPYLDMHVRYFWTRLENPETGVEAQKTTRLPPCPSRLPRRTWPWFPEPCATRSQSRS